MIYWNKSLPKLNIDYEEYKPFIKNEWFRKNYMYFAYGLMIMLFAWATITGGFRAGNLWIRILIFPFVYVIHESLHVLSVFRKGDIYLNYFGGIYLWLTPDVELSKPRVLDFYDFAAIDTDRFYRYRESDHYRSCKRVFVLYCLAECVHRRIRHYQFSPYFDQTVT